MSTYSTSQNRRNRSSRKLKKKSKKKTSKVDEYEDYSEEEDEEEEQQQRILLEVLGSLLNSESFSDVHFIVGIKEKKRIPAHRILLSARSEVFEKMLNGPMKESNVSMDIEVPDMDSSAFLTMLRFVYTGKSDLTPETAMGTLYAAKKYGVSGLRQSCVRYLKNLLTTKNACMMLEQAQLFDEQSLEKLCMNLIERNTKDIFSSVGFRELPANCLASILSNDNLRVREIVVFRACVKWAEAECKRQRLEVNNENKRIVLKDIIPLIRFPLISANEVADEVAESGVLAPEELVHLFCFLYKKSNSPTRFQSKPRIKFLVIGTDWAHEVKLLISSNCPAIVDAINPNIDQPTLSLCEQYHGILVFSSSAFLEPEELGDILADYIDGGGGVVIAAIASDSDNHGVGGRYIRDEYLPLIKGDRSYDSRHTLGKRLMPDHPILKNIHAFDGGPQSWRVKSTISPNSKLIAEWEDGVPLVAEKVIRDRNCSVALNMWPPSRSISKDGWETFTDGDKFIINSLMYVANTH